MRRRWVTGPGNESVLNLSPDSLRAPGLEEIACSHDSELPMYFNMVPSICNNIPGNPYP